MIFETFTAGPCETNAYLVACPNTHKAFVVDVPPDSGKAILAKAKALGVVIEKILLTHSHWDHIGDVAFLQEATKAAVLVDALDAPNLRSPGADQLPLYFAIKGIEPDDFLQEGKSLEIGNFSISVIKTPGHTPGGVCFYLEKQGVLFSGDTLFQGTMGRIDFPTSNAKSMWTSLTRLSMLPKNTRVFPGHGEETTIGQENWITHAKEKFNH